MIVEVYTLSVLSLAGVLVVSASVDLRAIISGGISISPSFGMGSVSITISRSSCIAMGLEVAIALVQPKFWTGFDFLELVDLDGRI